MILSITELESELNRMEAVRTECERNAALRFPVLVVDDSPDDRFFVRRAMAESANLRPVLEATSGKEAIAYLAGTGIYADRVLYPFPALVLLDIEMPGLTGFDVLQWIKGQNFPSLRIVMLSGSLDSVNIQKALNMGVDYYQLKSPLPHKVTALVRRLELLMLLVCNREPQRIMKEEPNPSRGMRPQTALELVDGRSPDWNAALTAAGNSRRNFILILEKESDLEKLWAALGTTTIVPTRVSRWSILAMAEALQTEDYEHLLEICNKEAVYLVEQITLQRNAPTSGTNRFMLYCELRGIVSEHETIEQAGMALLGYLEFFKRARLLPLAGIYEYSAQRWTRVKKLTSH